MGDGGLRTSAGEAGQGRFPALTFVGQCEELAEVLRRLAARYDVGSWHWQVDTPALEVCLGAILVQHTAWANVEKALASLRAAGAFSLAAIEALPQAVLAGLIRAAGMPDSKAGRLKAFALLARQWNGLDSLLGLPTSALRPVLLSTSGIGPETADVILLYGAGRPAFVADAYTVRLMRRLGLSPEQDGYGVWQAWLEERLPREVQLCREYHAAIVLHGKETCRARPRCADCVLLDMCPFGQRGQGRPV